jgi:Tol biopolymer transport system component
VAELRPRGKVIKTPQRLTLSESDEGAWDWTGDGQAVLFTSNRNGNWDIFRQNIGETDAEVIAATPEYEWHPNFGPDGAFIFYLVSEKPGPTATRLVRVPVGGGPPEVVLRGEKIRYFSCAREANLCVVVEEVEGDQVLTTFDPLKGRGEQLLISGFPEFSDNQNVVTARILSPQGRLLEKMKSGPEGLRLQVRSLKGAAVQEVVFKNLTGDYQFNGWSFDGKGIYITEWNFSDFTLLYAGLDAHSQVLWKRGTSPGWSLHYPIPSPDGRYLAFTAITYEANAWMLENF